MLYIEGVYGKEFYLLLYLIALRKLLLSPLQLSQVLPGQQREMLIISMKDLLLTIGMQNSKCNRFICIICF